MALATSAIACGGEDDGGGVDAATFDARAGGDASGSGDAAPAAGLVGIWSFEDDTYELSDDGTFSHTRPGEVTVGTYTFDPRTIVLEGHNADGDELTMTVTYALTEDGRLGLMARVQAGEDDDAARR